NAGVRAFPLVADARRSCRSIGRAPAADETFAEEDAMRTLDVAPTLSVEGLRVVVHAGSLAPANGTYRCLCCGVVVWRIRRSRHLPECRTQNCPRMWLGSEP